jgi:serine/threonine protein kinase
MLAQLRAAVPSLLLHAGTSMNRPLATDQTKILGRYHLLGELGRGGMSDLYLACPTLPADLARLVVIKRLRPLDPAAATVAFADETRIAQRLLHRNLVRTYEVGIEDGHHLIVMEYLHGPNLRQLRRAAVARHGIPAGVEIAIACQVLEGLHHAHELRDEAGKPLRVVHRDLSAENVIVTEGGEVKVLDFGIAKASDSLAQTRAGSCRGRLRNMPPEQLRGEKVDRRADVYAVGVMLWEGLSGRPYWGTQSDVVVAARLARGEVPRLEELGPAVPEPLRSICARAVAFHPHQRYSTAAELAAALGRYAQNLWVTRTELAAFVQPLFAEQRARIEQLVAGPTRAIDDLVMRSATASMAFRPDLEMGSGYTCSFTSDIPTTLMPSRAPTGPVLPTPRAPRKIRGLLAGVSLFALGLWGSLQLNPDEEPTDRPAVPSMLSPRILPPRAEPLLRAVPAAASRRVRPLSPASAPVAPRLRDPRRVNARPRPPLPGPSKAGRGVERRPNGRWIDLQNPYSDTSPRSGKRARWLR